MFILSIPCTAEDNAPFGWMKPRVAYPSLDAAIAAAINSDIRILIRPLSKKRMAQ